MSMHIVCNIRCIRTLYKQMREQITKVLTAVADPERVKGGSLEHPPRPSFSNIL